MGSSCSATSKRNIVVPTRLSNEKKNRSRNINGPAEGEEEKLKSQEVDGASNNKFEIYYQKINSKEYLIGEYFLFENEIYNEKSRKLRREKKDKLWLIKKGKSTYQQQNSQHDLYRDITDFDIGEFILKRPSLYFNLLRKGPPMQYRWAVWKNFLTPEKFYSKNLFENLTLRSSVHEYDIKKDVNRTFTHQKFFSGDDGTKGQDFLLAVLKSISIYFPNIGYCQSMNFLAAFFLLVGNGNCVESFWMFVSLLRDSRFLLMGFFEKGFPLLDFYIQLFKSLLQSRMNKLYNHLETQQLPDPVWIYKWFLTIFTYSVPLADSIRIWDFVLQEGLVSMIRVAMGLLKFLEKDLLKLDVMGIDNIYKYLNKESLESQMMHNDSENHKKANFTIQKLDIEKVIAHAKKIKISDKEIETFADNYSKEYKDKVPELYLKYFKNISNFASTKQLNEDYQQEIDNYLKHDEGAVPDEASSQINVNVFLKN